MTCGVKDWALTLELRHEVLVVAVDSVPPQALLDDQLTSGEFPGRQPQRSAGQQAGSSSSADRYALSILVSTSACHAASPSRRVSQRIASWVR